MIKKYDGLDNDYLQGDGSVPIAINDAIPLEIQDGEILQTLSLEDFSKIAFVVENDSTVDVDYLAMLGTQSSDAVIEIVKDVTASSGYALKLTGAQRIIFATKTSYVPNLLKKLTVKARCATGNTNTLSASLVGYKDGNFINKDGDPLLANYPKITLNEEVLADSYGTYVGFVSGVGSDYKEGDSTADAPSNMPIGTDEVAMILDSSGGVFYVDVISLEEVPNSITEIPDGTGVYNMVSDISSDNRITPSEKQTFQLQYDSIVAEYPIILATATDRSLSGTDYTVAYDALVAYVTSTGILDDLTVSTDITGSAFRAVVASYVEEKARIQESISNFDASELKLSASSNVIDISSRGTLKTDYIYLEVTTTILALDDITWSATDGTTDYSSAIIDLATPVVGQKRLNCSLIESDSITVTASITENGKTYTGVQAIAVVQPNVYDVVNFGAVTIDAPTETTDGEPLAKGDYFLWGGETNTTYTKGAIYEYTGTAWVESTNGDLVMTMFDSFADLANDVDSTVMGNAVIKKLVAIDAIVQNLVAQNIKAGPGDGTASSGFRFRAQTDSVGDGTNVPVFDVNIDDKTLLKVTPTGTDAGDVILGNYNETTKTGGIKYDASEDKMLGNVAYDQWDLIIESDADLALLTTGSTTYSSVLITPGTYTTTAQIDLDAHSVERFVGLGNNSIIKIDYVIPSDEEAINCDLGTKVIRDFKIINNATQINSNTFFINDKNQDFRLVMGVEIFGGLTCSTDGFGNFNNGNLISCRASYCNNGFNNCNYVSNCLAYYNAENGFYKSSYLTNCSSIKNNNGFNDCEFITSCGTSFSYDNGCKDCDYITNCSLLQNFGNGFDNCNYITTCSTVGNTLYGFKDCDYVSTCKTYMDGSGAYNTLPSNEAVNNWS